MLVWEGDTAFVYFDSVPAYVPTCVMYVGVVRIRTGLFMQKFEKGWPVCWSAARRRRPMSVSLPMAMACRPFAWQRVLSRRCLDGELQGPRVRE